MVENKWMFVCSFAINGLGSSRGNSSLKPMWIHWKVKMRTSVHILALSTQRYIISKTVVQRSTKIVSLRRVIGET